MSVRTFAAFALTWAWSSLALAQPSPAAPAEAPSFDPASPAEAPSRSEPASVPEGALPESPKMAPAEPEAPPAAPPPPPEAPVELTPQPPPYAALPAAQPPVTRGVEERDEEVDDGELGTHQRHVLLQLGVRTTYVTDPGFDLFADNDAFVQLGVSGGAVLLEEGPLSLAALVGWDYGVAEGTARGVPTQLWQHRLWLGAEGRYHVLRRLYVFARVAPALLSTRASLRDPIAQAEREAGGWLFGADGSAGAAVELFGQERGRSTKPRGWLAVDGGYSWAMRDELSFAVSEEVSAPARTAALDLGDLAVRGGFFRAAFAVTF